MDLNTLILFVTSRCNSRCETCFYWEDLNRPGDLTFQEIEALSAGMPRFHELWLSGGEPMMRPRLAEILGMFYHRNGVRTLNLPTNGLFAERTLELMEYTSRELPGMEVNLNLALDGFASTHDRIRGVPGNFEQALETIRLLTDRESPLPGVRVHVNSVVTADNIDELEDLGWWLARNLDLNGHYFQVIRGEAKDPGLKRITRRGLGDFYRSVKPIHEHYGRKLARRKGGSLRGWLKQLYYTQTIYFHYTLQERNFETSDSWPMPCTAGKTILVVDYNGDLRACELREKILNLRDVNFDFRGAYSSRAVREETEQIVKDACWCTHVCFIHDSLKSSPRAKFFDIPLGAKVV